MINLKKILKNKKAEGGEKYLSPWNFIIWIVILVLLVGGALAFFYNPTDVRQREANLLVGSISQCLSQNFILSDFVDSSIVFSRCNLNKEIFDKEKLYYFRIAVYEDVSKEPVKTLIGGYNWQTECEYQLSSYVQEKNFPSCSERTFIVGDKGSGKDYTIKILGASNQN